MSSEQFYLHSIIFKVDFKQDFTLIDKRGHIATELRNAEVFDAIRMSQEGLSVGATKKNPYVTATFNPDNINGRFEKGSLDLAEAAGWLKVVSKIYNGLEISTEKITRAGVRFFFLREEKSFEEANAKAKTLFSEKLFSIMSESKVQSEEIFDSYLAMRFSKKKFKMRIGTGPLQPDEKRKIFEAPDVIDMENAILLDLDYYVSEYGYKDLHLEKLVSEAYKESLGIVQTFHEKLE